MINKLILLSILILIGGIGSSKFCQAEDFNFSVPVELNNMMPGVNSIELICMAQQQSGSSVGLGTTNIPVPDTGNLSTTGNVKFNANTNIDPSLATKYRCWFLVVNSSGGKYQPGPGIEEQVPKTNTDFVPEVNGNIQ